jgi:hypothetical protein
MPQPMLSWVLLPSKVFSLFVLENAFTPSSSYVLSEELSEESCCPCTLEFQRTKRLACLEETADLLGVYALIVLQDSLVFVQPWLMDLPQGTRCVTALRLPLFRLVLHRPE